MKALFVILLIWINIFAVIFLKLIFHGSRGAALSEQRIISGYVLWGVGVSFFFSLATALIVAIFQPKPSFDIRFLSRSFIIQFAFLLVVYAAIHIYYMM